MSGDELSANAISQVSEEVSQGSDFYLEITEAF